MDFSLVSCISSSLVEEISLLTLGLLGLFVLGGGAAWTRQAARRLLNPLLAAARAHLGRWRWQLCSRGLPPVSSGDALREGAVVRVRGIVAGGAARPAAVSGLASVACQHAVGERSAGTITSGFTAADFTLTLPDGTAIEVSAGAANAERRLKLFDRRPHRWTDERVRDGWFSESRVGPGDVLEVLGRLERRVAPNAPRFGDRRPALQWTLVAPERGLSLAFDTRGAMKAVGPYPRRLRLQREGH